MLFFLTTLHVMLCFSLILIILLQPGKDGAAVFGGGGHANASGFTLESTAEHKRQAVIQEVVAAVKTALGPAVGEAPSDEKPLVRPE